MKNKAILEGILFIVGDEGVTIKEMMEILNTTEEEIKQTLIEIRKDYEQEDRGLRISFLGNSFKLTTKEEHKEYYEKLVSNNKGTSLSNASLEVLAIVAYNEPISRLKIDEIRGVNSSQIVRRLHARGFLKISGKDDSIGKPNLYKITDDFLDYFGLASKEDLPKINFETIKEEEKELYTSNYKEE